MNRITLFLTYLVFSACNEAPPVKKELGVYLDFKDSSNVYTINERYRLKGDKCKIAWEVLTSKTDKSLGLNLRYMDYISKEDGCEWSTQAKSHKEILSYLFNSYNISKLTWVRIPSLKMINPTGTWNEKIKELAAKNDEWIEYTKKYPKHKSGKSSNGLLKEELNNNLNIIQSFTDLFLPKLSLKVSGVEKVFTEKLNNQTVFYDAGLYEFRVFH